MTLISNYKTEIATANYFKRLKANEASVSALVSKGLWSLAASRRWSNGVIVCPLQPVHHHIGGIAIHLHSGGTAEWPPVSWLAPLVVVIVIIAVVSPITALHCYGFKWLHSFIPCPSGCLPSIFPVFSSPCGWWKTKTDVAPRRARQWADCLMSNFNSKSRRQEAFAFLPAWQFRKTRATFISTPAKRNKC